MNKIVISLLLSSVAVTEAILNRHRQEPAVKQFYFYQVKILILKN